MEVGAIDIPKNNHHHSPHNIASSYEEDLILEPLSFTDIQRNKHACDDDFSPEAADTVVNGNSGNFFSVVMGMKRKQTALQRNAKGIAKDQVQKSIKKLNVNVAYDEPMRLQWKQAIMKAKLIEDPWANFHIDEYETETATRYRYNALKKSWVKDEVYVKMEKKPFNHGAMRECFRLKKLSNFTQKDNWKTAANYVVKRYMDVVDRKVYFDDVRLQMDAKLWGEEYNRHNPPKKVDIFQMSVLEFLHRPGKPLYHVEHYIEGNYIKYNSNSGYVVENACRFTPQSFSHFTFERSGHQVIIVDIQGVGDLYTDPQIHTVKGDDYGDGNLGTRGMALFFHSHTCNDICHSLGLSPFDLYETEISEPIKAKLDKNFHTMIRGTEEICMSPSRYEKSHWHEFLRHRSISTGSNLSSSPPDSLSHISSEVIAEAMDIGDVHMNEDDFPTPKSPDSGVGSLISSTRRDRCSSSDSGSLILESERTEFGLMVTKASRPSCVYQEISQLKDDNDKRMPSVLGQIHLGLAKYHELCRFTTEEDATYDKGAALFHLEQASKCGILEATLTLAKIYMQMPHDILVEVEIPESDSNFNKGMELLLLAAQAGDRSSMLTIAKALDTGLNLGTEMSQSWNKAVYWYDKAVNMLDVDESGEYDGCVDDPTYQIIARQAEMYLTGGYGLRKSPENSGELFTAAADAAMAAMKGRLANRYYSQAEEAWSQMED